MGVRPRLLIVDDDPSVLFTYSMILQQRGYEAVAVGTLAEAREALDDGHFKLVICDLTVEHARGGFDIIDYARRAEPGRPAVLLTGLADADAMSEAERKNIVLIFKPVDVRDFLKSIATLAGPGQP